MKRKLTLRQNEVLQRMLTNRIEATRRITFCLTEAERQLGLPTQPDVPLLERIDIILGAAANGGGLDPDLYDLAWTLRAAVPRTGAGPADFSVEVPQHSSVAAAAAELAERAAEWQRERAGLGEGGTGRSDGGRLKCLSFVMRGLDRLDPRIQMGHSGQARGHSLRSRIAGSGHPIAQGRDGDPPARQ
jgi:hypothetical protein